MGKVLFWIIAVLVWFAGCVAIGTANAALFDRPLSIILSFLGGALWGLVSSWAGTQIYRSLFPVDYSKSTW